MACRAELEPLELEIESSAMHRNYKFRRGTVNVGKTKVLQCRVSRVQSEDSGKHPGGVCRKGDQFNIVCRVGS